MDPTAFLSAWGPLGVFCGLMLVYIRSTIKREEARSDRLEAERVRISTLIQDKLAPAMERATIAGQDTITAVQLLRASLDRIQESPRV